MRSAGFKSPLAHPYLMAVSESNLKLIRLLLRILLTTLFMTRFLMEMLGRNRCPRHDASKKTRFVTVSIPSSVPFDSFNGIENLLISEEATARLHSLTPEEG